eukprot:5043427-Karenia_brevis.AAC.1
MKIQRLKNDEMVAHEQLDQDYICDDATMSFSILASNATHKTFKGKVQGKGDASRCCAGLSVGNMVH